MAKEETDDIAESRVLKEKERERDTCLHKSLHPQNMTNETPCLTQCVCRVVGTPA